MTSPARSGKVLLSVKGVGLVLGGRQILKDVSTEVHDYKGVGSIICLLGPSGIGKSQLSWIIAGLRKPDTGSVETWSLSEGRLKPTAPGRVSVVPQTYPMFDYTTVESNLRIAGRLSGLPSEEIQRRFDLYVSEFMLGDQLKKYPRELSGGQKQRAAIARQLMGPASCIIMDEPFSGLDPLMKRRALQMIVKMSHLEDHSVVIVVTHDVTEGMSVADTVWLMGRTPEGAKIVDTLDLAAMGLAWRPDIQRDPTFHDLVLSVKDSFSRLV